MQMRGRIVLLGLATACVPGAMSAQPSANKPACNAPVTNQQTGIMYRPQVWPRPSITAAVGLPDSYVKDLGLRLSDKALANPNVTTLSFQYAYNADAEALVAKTLRVNFGELSYSDGSPVDGKALIGRVYPPSGGVLETKIDTYGGITLVLPLEQAAPSLDQQILNGGGVFLSEICAGATSLKCLTLKMNFTKPQNIDDDLKNLIKTRASQYNARACTF